MTKKEQILQKIYEILESVAMPQKAVLFRNKSFDYEPENEQKVIVLRDGKTEVIDTVLSPRIDTIEQTINLELYVQTESEEKDNTKLDAFEDLVRKTLIANFDLQGFVTTYSLTQSNFEVLTSENGDDYKSVDFDVVVVFDDV